jgi:mRNA interferase MazF
MRRGDIYRVFKPKQDDPRRYRFYVVVSRQVLLDSAFSTVVCAPIYTKGHGLTTEVSVGITDGLKHQCWITCDNLRSITKSSLTDFVASLSDARLRQLDIALSIALDLS